MTGRGFNFQAAVPTLFSPGYLYIEHYIIMSPLFGQSDRLITNGLELGAVIQVNYHS